VGRPLHGRIVVPAGLRYYIWCMCYRIHAIPRLSSAMAPSPSFSDCSALLTTNLWPLASDLAQRPLSDSAFVPYDQSFVIVAAKSFSFSRFRTSAF
jgi:hypothetical protein